MSTRETSEHVQRIWEEVHEREDDEPHLMDRDHFLQVVAEYLIEDGTMEDMQPCYYRARTGRSRMQVAGYGISEGESILDLAVVEHAFRGTTLPRHQIIQRFREVLRFVERCREGLHHELEPASPPYDMAQRIHEQWPKIERVRIFLLTDGLTTIKQLSQEMIGNVPVTQDLWDLTRIGRLMSSGVRQEDLDIDLTDPEVRVTCLPAPPSPEGYQCYLALLPGQLLAELYGRHGSRLLQRNVRAFLQNRNKVNKGINTTVREEPERFLAYNNGISATARDITTAVEPDGMIRIVRIVEPQIVNGGQTTASLHHALTKDRADLSGILVPAKITVVKNSLIEQLVPRISRYANSQNAIRDADFEANSQFHVSLEELSRRTWAPAPEGSTEQYRWYYERVRGQYNVDVSRNKAGAKRSEFKRQNKRFTKTDAAKYDAAWRRKPHIVSLGGEKCFQWWTNEVVSGSDRPDTELFKGLIAKRILFEETRKRLMELKLGGYLAQTAAYVVSLVTDRQQHKIDLHQVWQTQQLPPDFESAALEVVSAVRQVLVSPPENRNVTEWCKKEACWTAVQAIDWIPSA